MDRWVGKVAVVTGASSGIGAGIAKALVEKGVLVVGIARRIEKIEDLSRTLTDQPGKLFALRCDVAKEDDILRSFRWIADNVGHIHILVNNAGLTRPTNLVEGSTDDWRRVFEVNVMALCICTREAIKIMRQKKIAGHIIHINSIAGHYVPVMPKPNFNVYPASKFAVTALAESLRQELCYFKSPIKITSISPGLVRTEFTEGFPQDGTKEKLDDMPDLRPEDIAEGVIYALGTGPHVNVSELTIRPVGNVF
ncbi:farnesol dehydrogenase-like [Diabrotica undecimpunctata]|uniref:farnesol dehydrogenase-like n=1 Tax=Diabrotica undecimpunctata TaxID=50387 RepID=UPI003B63AF34